MNKIIAVFLVAVILVTGCQPSETAVQIAIAQTQAAIPTETAQPTKISTPTETAKPTKTAYPTPDYQRCANILAQYTWDYADVRITEYTIDHNKGALVIRAKAWFSSITPIEVIAGVLFSLDVMLDKCSSPIPESITKIYIYTHDSLSQETGLVIGDWSDIVAFSNDEITVDEWLLKVDWQKND
jgi:hypothetical protein